MGEEGAVLQSQLNLYIISTMKEKSTKIREVVITLLMEEFHYILKTGNDSLID